MDFVQRIQTMKMLKNIDYKAMLIDHAEKFGLGFIVLIVLLVFSGTSWSRFSEITPDQLKAKIADANTRIKSPSNDWPQAEAAKYQVVDFTDKARDVFNGISVTKYEFSTPIYHPLYRKKEKAREPDYLAPQYLIADAGEAILGIAAQSTPFDTETKPGDGSKSPENSVPSDYKPGPGASTPGFGPGGPGMAGPGGPGGGHGGGHGSSAPPGGKSAPFGATPPGPGGGPHSMMPPGMGGMDGPMGGGGGITARGERYVAVRAIVPIREQIQKAMRALNMSPTEASAAIEYTNFVLERQTALAGSDPWSGKWEEVSIQKAVEILAECSDFDPDPVPSDLKDAVFTMELPYRLLKYWGDHATHPNIKNFQLTPAEWEREQKLQQKLVEEYDKYASQTKPAVERKGLTGVQRDIRQMGNEVMAQSTSTDFLKGMQSYMGEGGGQRMQAPDIKDRLTASGRLYLFRYFDFDVQPGKAYRYRLKLELKNPNFERPYEEVENPDFTRGAYRDTAWSNISNPAVVPASIHYFLKDVERDPVREEKPSGRKPVANVAMFEWDSKLGTMLADSLKILNVGQFISEKKKTWVLDPATPSFEEKDVSFVTDDVLVDASGDMEFAPELHPDLQLKPEKGKRDVKVGLLPEALVVNGLGELKEIDPISELDEEKELDQRVTDERANYKYLKDRPKESESALDGSNAFNNMMGINPPGKSSGPGMPKPKNARKKQVGGMGASMPGMPGGGYGSDGGGGGTGKSKSKKKGAHGS
jgi:hypothetical protein